MRDPPIIISVEDLKLGKVLGEGAEGIVCKGEWGTTEVAIKVVTLSMGMTFSIEGFLALAQEEAKIMIPLRHPNIVTVYGVAIDFARGDGALRPLAAGLPVR